MSNTSVAAAAAEVAPKALPASITTLFTTPRAWHVMVDIETMGVNPNAPVMSIGWVRFDKDGVDRASAKEVHLSLDIEIKSGAVVDASTIKFWMKQPDDARRRLFRPDDVESYDSPSDSLYVFRNALPYGDDLLGIWGNGANFDNVLLRQCYERHHIPVNWPFYKERCFRTLKTLLPNVAAPPFTGIKHGAMDDAVHQAEHAVLILQALEKLKF